MFSFFEVNQLADSGNYVNGLKDSLWLGYHINGQPYYKELYANGKLIKGVSRTIDGKSYFYTKDYIPPEPIGLSDQYNQYIKSNLIFPPLALKNNVEGIVMVDVNVDSLGNITSIVPKNKIPYGCTEEAIRIIKNGPHFTPALFLGQPVSSYKRVFVRFEIKK